MNYTKELKLVFFGGSDLSVYVLDELKLHGILPTLIITTPDKPKGRKLVLTPTPVKVWAQNHNIEVIDPVSLKKDNADLISKLQALNSQLFLVASYGKLIPREIFENPQHKVEEGCLSVRWLYGKVERNEKTLVRAYDEKGKLFTFGGSGLLSQVFQHEIDHLNGALFIDKAKDLKEMKPEK